MYPRCIHNSTSRKSGWIQLSVTVATIRISKFRTSNRVGLETCNSKWSLRRIQLSSIFRSRKVDPWHLWFSQANRAWMSELSSFWPEDITMTKWFCWARGEKHRSQSCLSGTYQAPIRHLSLCVGVTWERQVLGIKHVEGIVPFTLNFLHSHSSRLARVLLGNGMNQALDAVPKCLWLGGWMDGWMDRRMDGCLDPMMTFLRGIGWLRVRTFNTSHAHRSWPRNHALSTSGNWKPPAVNCGSAIKQETLVIIWSSTTCKAMFICPKIWCHKLRTLTHPDINWPCTDCSIMIMFHPLGWGTKANQLPSQHHFRRRSITDRHVMAYHGMSNVGNVGRQTLCVFLFDLLFYSSLTTKLCRSF